MEFKVQLTLVILSCVCVNVVNSSKRDDVCPNNGETWDSDDKDGKRCILRCNDGYVPSGCHVIRPLGNGGFNTEIPKCEKAPWVSGRTLVAIGVGIGTVAAVPMFLYATGFTAAGVAAGSLAAWLQGPAIVAGGWFAFAQSVGAAGMAAATKVLIGGAAYKFSDYVMDYFTGCESE